jgi:hypothetical protein
MITKEEIDYLYSWSKDKKFLLKKEPSSAGHPNKPILFCPLKLTFRDPIIRKSIVNGKVYDILSNPEILFCGCVVLQPQTEHGPHKDLNIYVEEYKRIQIPLSTADKDNCYMIWNGERVHWKAGEPQVFEVMDYTHEAYNYSDNPMRFLFLDVKKSTNVTYKQE